MDEKAKAEGRRILREWLDEEETEMTDNESRNQMALHTILATCLRPRVMSAAPHSHVELLESRLNEIERLATLRVTANAAAKGD